MWYSCYTPIKWSFVVLFFLVAVHCWEYRRFVTAKAAVTDRDEFEYTTKKILENFSNYSAWHQRSVLLLRLHSDEPSLLKAIGEGICMLNVAVCFIAWDHVLVFIYTRVKYCGLCFIVCKPCANNCALVFYYVRMLMIQYCMYKYLHVCFLLHARTLNKITSELEWIKNAYFTDPEDQAAWIYMRWLMSVRPPPPAAVAEQIRTCDELLEVAPNSKCMNAFTPCYAFSFPCIVMQHQTYAFNLLN